MTPNEYFGIKQPDYDNRDLIAAADNAVFVQIMVDLFPVEERNYWYEEFDVIIPSFDAPPF